MDPIKWWLCGSAWKCKLLKKSLTAFRIIFALFGLVVILLAIILLKSAGESNQTAMAVFGLPNFHQVEPYLYRGAAPTPLGITTLKKLGIKTIIDFRVNPELVQAEHQLAESCGMRYINLPVKGYIIKPEYQKVFFDIAGSAAANSANGPIFVHCAHGSDRTGVMVGMWRVQHDHWSYMATIEEMLKYGFLIHKLQGN